MSHLDNKKGFTIVELMLAMAFVSMLLLAIAATTMQIGNIYNRGLMLKEINQAGSSLASAIQSNITTSTAFDLNSSHYVQTKSGSNIIGGRLCTGQYSFIWNYGKAIASNDSAMNKYSSGSEIIRFIKVPDSDNSYCSSATSLISVADSPVELLDAGQHSLAIHYFNISTAASAGDSATGQRLYNMEFNLGTNNNDITGTEVDNSISYGSGTAICKTNDEIGADPSYCYISKFKFIARAGNAG